MKTINLNLKRTGIALYTQIYADARDFPLTVAVAICLLWIFSCAWIFTIMEGWSFWMSLYFLFQSITTIGLGLSPKRIFLPSTSKNNNAKFSNPSSRRRNPTYPARTVDRFRNVINRDGSRVDVFQRGCNQNGSNWGQNATKGYAHCRGMGAKRGCRCIEWYCWGQ